MTADSFIQGQLAAYAIQQGARHGGLQSMLLAAFVIRNRVDAGWHGGDWMKVLATAPEVAGNDYSADPWPIDLQTFTNKKLLEKMHGVYWGEEPEVFSGGKVLYFADLGDSRSLRPWFVENICRDLLQHPRIGNVAQVTLFS